MRHFLTRFFTCMIVCVGLFISHTRDAMALLGVGRVLYVCAEYDDYFDYSANAVYFNWNVTLSDPYTIENNVHENCTPPSGTTFAGWLVTGWDDPINSLYGGEIHQPGDVINLTDIDQFFIAQYEPVGATYTVTYSCNGGTGTAPSNETATENQSFTPAANTCTAPSGYSGFSGWAVSGTNDVKPAGTAFTWEYTENKTFTAQWTGNTVPITWYNGDTQLTVPSNAQSCEYGGTITLPPEPTPPAPGLRFDGWTIKVMAQPDCSEVSGLKCPSTPGCIKIIGETCRNIVESCASVTDQETCNKSGQTGRMNCTCSWRNGSCVTGNCEPGAM